MTKVELLYENGRSVLRVDDVSVDVDYVIINSKKGTIDVRYEPYVCVARPEKVAESAR